MDMISGSTSLRVGPGPSTSRGGSSNHLQIPGAEDGYGGHQSSSWGMQARPSSPTSQLFLASHSRVRRHRSLPSPTFTAAIPSPLALRHHPHRSSSFRLPVSNYLARLCLMRRLSRKPSSDACMEMRV